MRERERDRERESERERGRGRGREREREIERERCGKEGMGNSDHGTAYTTQRWPVTPIECALLVCCTDQIIFVRIPNQVDSFVGELTFKTSNLCSRPALRGAYTDPVAYIYRGTSLIRNCLLLGPYSRPVPRGLWWS